MSTLKKGIGIDVLEAAERRISFIFDRFQQVCVSFSGGKDSTVLLHLAADEARRRRRRIAILFVDWEAQYKLTMDHVQRCFDLYADIAEPFWVALPIRTWSGVSMHEPEWTAWDPAKSHLWVRDQPPQAIIDEGHFPFYRHAMLFEEFIDKFHTWLSERSGRPVSTACLVGIRADESLNRFRTLIKDKETFAGQRWTTWLGDASWNAYPIYDWHVDDVWTYFGRNGLPYNKIYDRMHQAGLTPHQMRICEPYGNEQRRGLWLYHVLEPETWPKVVARVAGANAGALYANDRGNMFGNQRVDLPPGHNWKSFCIFLLDTMPTTTAEHYRSKIAVYVNYCMKHYPGYERGLPDQIDGDTGGNDIASWRRVCRAILRHDYWCRSLSFSPTKSTSYQRYIDVMRARRKKWGMT
jgi:predicted phosphoadenosine phosphosulfate sulfurtransferase